MLLITIGMMGCNRAATTGDDAVGFHLQIAPAQSAPGGEVTLTLRNHSEETGGYNLCTSTLVRGANAAGEPVPEDRVCTLELRTLDPGEADSFTLNLPADLPAGLYRYTTGVEQLETGGRVEVATAPFQVGSPP